MVSLKGYVQIKAFPRQRSLTSRLGPTQVDRSKVSTPRALSVERILGYVLSVIGRTGVVFGNFPLRPVHDPRGTQSPVKSRVETGHLLYGLRLLQVRRGTQVFGSFSSPRPNSSSATRPLPPSPVPANLGIYLCRSRQLRRETVTLLFELSSHEDTPVPISLLSIKEWPEKRLGSLTNKRT